MKRRQLLQLSASLPLMGGTAAVLTACGGGGGGEKPESTLPIPPVVRPGRDRPVDLQLQKGSYEFLRGKPAPSFGVNGALLGPAIVLTRGDALNVRVRNALDEESVLHWHGLQVPGESDGGPHAAIAAGGSAAVLAAVDQPAATLWYHAHPHGRTGYQTAMGIAGLLIVEDPASQGLGLPSAWGEDDLPLVIQDKYLDDQGQVAYRLNENTAGLGWLGNHVFVNGVSQPDHYAPQGWVRLRLLNGCNARSLRLGLSGGRGFQVIASDGGLLRRPVALTEIELAPGERYEIMVDGADARPFDLVMLRNDAQYGANVAPFDRDHRLLTIHPTLAPRDTRLPATLADLPDAVEPAGIRQRDIEFMVFGHFPMDPAPDQPITPNPPYDYAWNALPSNFDAHVLHHINLISVDGRDMESFDLATVNFTVPRGQTERWVLTSRHGDTMSHPFHVHGTQFRVLRLNGAPPPEHMRGWKDSVNIRGAGSIRSAPGTAEILVRFAHAAPAAHPYMVHCHILEHEDTGMMLSFAVQ